MQTGWYMEESQSRAGGQGDVWVTTQYSGLVILPFGIISFQSAVTNKTRISKISLDAKFQFSLKRFTSRLESFQLERFTSKTSRLY